MNTRLETTGKNENGFAIIGCLVIMTVLLMAGVYGIRKSSTEVTIARNDGQIRLEFYDAEAGLIDALENYRTWMTNPFLLGGELSAATYTSPFTNPSGTAVATVQARCIENTGTDVFGGGPADDVPVMRHIAVPPPGSGYSMLFFESRKYGVTVASTDGNTQIQIGGWKVFNTF